MSCGDLSDADFVFFWEIKYIIFWNELKQDVIKSATFTADSLFGTRWELSLKRNLEDQSFDLLLERSSYDDGPEEMNIKLKFIVLNKETPLKTMSIPQITASKGSICSFPSILKHDEIVNETFIFSPDRLLTIRCFFKLCVNMPQVCKSMTAVDLEHVSFIWKTSIAATNIGEISAQATSLLKRAPPLDIFLFNEIKDDCQILRFTIDGQKVLRCSENFVIICKITLLSGKEKTGPSLQSRHSFQSGDDTIWHFPQFFKVSDLEEEFCESLMFCFDLELSYGEVTSKIEETRNIHQNFTDLKCQNFQYFYPIYSEGLFFDVELRVENESFSAHKDILCVRSPIFKNKIMKNPDANEVHITDLDGGTLDNLLKCMYSDLSLKTMQPFLKTLLQYDWTKFKKLYAAADKYKVTKLKNVCSKFLVSNINSKNVIECLKLAELYKDYYLKVAANNYFSTYADEILNGEAFKELLILNQSK